MTITQIKAEFRQEKNAQHASAISRFFKTGKGQYGEGDQFLGIKVPVIRKYAKKYKATQISVLSQLVTSQFHEERLLALIILVMQYQQAVKEADTATRNAIYKTYLKAHPSINNWDLVDVTTEHIMGAQLFGTDCKVLYTWAKSKILWKRRMAIMATFHFIRRGDFYHTLKIAEILLHDEHDLIHKAVGWLLREIGKREQKVEESFLKKHAHVMPRTMLRYAIEKFPEKKRRAYLQRRSSSTTR
ncbi:MAG: DNA alkylation repair protein [Bdellovibrionales bacterium GWA2_49_15]|nr:MAG: DNA alkylation repair protein [Bdellovibrionales bacterium GWA2_49_15]HAZ12860.1 DNA alkylation repair protein [Bdellovibrionales bacterium]